jgi:putative membrane protein
MTGRALIVAAAVALAGTSVIHAQKPGTPGDQSFVQKMAQGNAAEVETGQLALQKSKNTEVKQFAQMMVDDHRKAGDDLKGLAQRKNITVTTQPTADAKATKERLSKLDGAAFDRAYIDAMVDGHREVVAAVRSESLSGMDPDVKAWAAKTLPTIETHLMHAQEVERSLEGKSATH